MISNTAIASILRGTPASGDELRQALTELADEGLVLVHRDDLAALRSAVNFDRLNHDIDLRAHVLVDALRGDRLDEPAGTIVSNVVQLNNRRTLLRAVPSGPPTTPGTAA